MFTLSSPTIIAAISAAIGTPLTAQISFGLSISGDDGNPSSLTSEDCSQDWIEVNSK